MNFVRQIVSGPKHRYQEEGYNLDLTYITPRIIAMAYPAEGIEQLYRNSIEDVAQLLQKKHQKNYQIINVSGRKINEQKLCNIHSYYWEDHKTPEIQTLFIICEQIMNYLIQSNKRVTVVHCKHGKGRTGTLICCFLLFSGFFKTAEEALKFYAKKRYQKEGYGVTQPCQIKYVHYFSQVLNSQIPLFPSVVALTKVQIKGDNSLANPYFKLKDVGKDQYIFKTKTQELNFLEIQIDNQSTVIVKKPMFFKGDAILEIKHSPIVGKNMVANYPFNTAFLDRKIKKVSVPVGQLSPLSAVRSGLLSKKFKLNFQYEYICSCTSVTKFSQRCKKCRPFLEGQYEKWKQIQMIIKNKPNIDSQEVLYGKCNKDEKHQADRAFSY